MTETVNERVAQNWSRRFKEGNTNLKNKSRPGRPYVMENEVLLEMVEQ